MFVTVFWPAADLRLQLYGINVELPDDVLPLQDEVESVLFNIKRKKHRQAIDIESEQMNLYS